MNSSLLPQQCFDIVHVSEISAARRYGQQIAKEIGFDETQAGKLAILITEAATNMLKHAGGGKLYIMQTSWHGGNAVDILAADKGPGIGNLGFAFRDGVSSTGTAGNGLGALRRLSDEFDVYSVRDKGACFFMRIWAAIPEKRQMLEIGGVCIPFPGEEVCGDAWAATGNATTFTMLMADGLGHGPEAAIPASYAVNTLRSMPSAPITRLMETADNALHGTRGAALAIARLSLDEDRLNFAGIGNISVCVVNGEIQKQLMSHNGIVGNKIRKIHEYDHPFLPQSLCIMHSDGISTQWDMDNYPGLVTCHPSLIAVVLLRDFSRGRDDATVLVARYPLNVRT
ncbi:ATP-binding protein [Undibacterium sp. TJN19]|uniref:ATP-binding protein n=1 Tax=Undibacterium sp. TJN19 TaxID=3413055 RepID=UPI003BEFC579